MCAASVGLPVQQLPKFGDVHASVPCLPRIVGQRANVVVFIF